MKRTPLKRTEPMRRGHRRAGAERTDWKTVRQLVLDRSKGCCEANTPDCPPGPHRGAHLHHLILRAQGGPDEAWNLLNVCVEAHVWIHANPALSYERDLLRRGVA